MWILLENILKILLIIVPLLIAVAYFTLFERKVIASMQRRRGPNVVGFFGLLQPLADGLKLLLKETVLPRSGTLYVYCSSYCNFYAKFNGLSCYAFWWNYGFCWY